MTILTRVISQTTLDTPNVQRLFHRQTTRLGGTNVVVAGLAYRGAVAYWQGLALHTIGRLHDAEVSLRAGLAQHQAINGPPWIAQAEPALATTVLAQDPTRAATAAAHLETASETANQIGMTLLHQRCTSLRQQAQ